jgi:hypothetical protein
MRGLADGEHTVVGLAQEQRLHPLAGQHLVG